jgi:hypothetical protein
MSVVETGDHSDIPGFPTKITVLFNGVIGRPLWTALAKRKTEQAYSWNTFVPQSFGSRHESKRNLTVGKSSTKIGTDSKRP